MDADLERYIERIDNNLDSLGGNTSAMVSLLQRILAKLEDIDRKLKE